MKRHKHDELERIYSESESIDQALFAEQRSNILLYIGEHYNRRSSRYWSRIRDSRDLTTEQKIRITKNHIQKIQKTAINNLISHAPSVKPVPNNEKELQDQKAAEMNHAVWQYECERVNMREQVRLDAQDFANVGEVAMKIFWDTTKGRFLGYKPAVDPATGMQLVDEMGQPAMTDEPMFSGALVYERIYGFNLLRAKSAQTMEESPYLIVRKLVAKDELLRMTGDDPEKKQIIDGATGETFLIFEGTNQGYKQDEGQVLVKEYYFRPCFEYPMGYYYITTSAGVLFEGELPFGKFPIIYEGYDGAQTSPRHYSAIKQLRPYQIEINRASSKLAETQITLGDDKLLTQAGSKLTSGSTLPGIRQLQFTGAKPEVLPGRTGEQYLSYLNSQIEEMYAVGNVAEDTELNKQADPFAMLFFSLRDKKKFSLYAEKFERFQISKCRLALELLREYADENMLVPMVGRHEMVNIAEFKSVEPLSFQIKVKPQVDDIETMFGKQLVMNHAMQYVGGQLEREDIGRMMRAMPFGNFEEAFADLTLDYDSATNMILALDRGQMPVISPKDNHGYLIKRLVARMRQSDFMQLDPQVQRLYAQVYQGLLSIEAEIQKEIQAAQAGFIPSGGARVKVDYYVPKPGKEGAVERATLPAEAVDWLIKRLSQQGSSQEQLQTQQAGVLADLGQLMGGQPTPVGQTPPPAQDVQMAGLA